MALKNFLARIFKRSKRSVSSSAPDVAAATPDPASNVLPLCVAPLKERSPATQAIFPVCVNLRFHVVPSTTADGAYMSTQHSQVLPTLGTSCEGHAYITQGSAPLLETSPSNPPVDFDTGTTATQAIEIFDTIPNSVLPFESKDIETPKKCTGATPLIHIAGPSFGPTAEAVVPSMVPTIPDKSSSRLGPQRYNFVFPHFRLGQSVTPATRASSQLPSLAPHEPPRCPPGLRLPADRKPGVQAGHLRPAPFVHSAQQGSLFELPQDVPKRNLDNDASPQPPRCNTERNLADMFPILESSASKFQSYNCPPTSEVAKASTFVERTLNNGNLAYSIQAGGHKYFATAQVGSGGFGYVWYAIKDQQEEVAIKVIDKAGLLAQSVDCAKDKRPTLKQLCDGSQAAATAIGAEYEAFKRVTEERSPFLTPLLHAFEDENNFYFVMRFYPQTLRTRAKFGFMHWQLRLVAAELLLALQHLHKLRVVHLDLKMENVLITPSGHVCIADFGNAEVLDRKLTYQQFHNVRIRGASGTDGYLPPERVEGDQGYNFKTDTWTYGSILLELLLINGGHWYSIYHLSDGTHKFDDYKIPTGYNGTRRLAFVRPNDEIDLVQDKDAKDLLYSIFFPKHHVMRPELESIRSHPFFACIDWEKLENRKYDPMFKACLGDASLQSVDFGKIAIECSHPWLPEFKKTVLEDAIDNFGLGRMHVDYECPTELVHDAMHGATCRAPGTKVPQKHVCKCDLPADWNKG